MEVSYESLAQAARVLGGADSVTGGIDDIGHTNDDPFLYTPAGALCPLRVLFETASENVAVLVTAASLSRADTLLNGTNYESTSSTMTVFYSGAEQNSYCLSSILGVCKF
jgi:hypothetical protein